MNAQKRCRLLAVAIAGFALATSAQAASNAAPPSATTHAASAATKAGTKAATTAKSSKSKTAHKTAASHAARRTTRTRTASAEPASGTDTAYRAALRQCVTGPAAQRDSFIDDAIARYGHA